MIKLRKRLRRIRARRRARSGGFPEQTRWAREEGRIVAERERELARAPSARVEPVRLERLRVPIKGAALELRRRLRPLGAAIQTGLGWIAPPISRAAMVAVAIPAVAIAALLDFSLGAGAWLRRRIGALGARVLSALSLAVTPVRTLAVVTAVAAGLLGAAQFIDFRGVAVGEPEYRGEVGTVAEVPLTERKATGSAHLYSLGVLALAALVLTAATARGRWRLGRAIGIIGLVGIAVSALIDAPQGLDAGIAGVAYTGTEARLLEGFWVQLSASAALVVCGPLLGLYARKRSGERGWRTPRARHAVAERPADQGGGGIAAGLGA